MKYLYLLLLGLLLSFCKTNGNDYGGYKMEYDNAMERFIALDKSDTICLNPLGYKHKGSLINYYSNDEKINISCIPKEGKVIESFIDRLSFDDTFILIDQKPIDSICECNQICLQKKYRNLENLKTYDMCKEALDKSTFHQYWIIHKQSNSVYGPFNSQENLNKRKVLGVPQDLILKQF